MAVRLQGMVTRSVRSIGRSPRSVKFERACLGAPHVARNQLGRSLILFASSLPEGRGRGEGAAQDRKVMRNIPRRTTPAVTRMKYSDEEHPAAREDGEEHHGQTCSHTPRHSR
jgi:hypothetical protein